MSDFLQSPPELPDTWGSDRTLREALRFYLGDELFAHAEAELAHLGRVAAAPATLELARRAESEPPRHIPYTTWGERIDDIVVSDAWLELGRLGVEAGVTALPYEDSVFGERARLMWAGILSLWGPSSALASCPIAMTDGAARTLLEHGGPNELGVVDRLTTRDHSRAWTSGQWMTETAGGSDVSATGTVAVADGDGWRLWGTKWFTSATTAEVALTLARPQHAPPGPRGLSLFLVHRRTPDGKSNSIFVRRLKDKLGTRALPTAELELQGSFATALGDPLDGAGVKRISTMLNITRIHNSIGASGALARGLSWARAYARVRKIAGASLQDLPAHRSTLVDLAVDYATALELVLRCCELLGRVEAGTASPSEAALLRGLTPVTKLATGRWAIAGVTEAMEAVGGVGYCEDSTIPALVRNTHVIPIWEGTTNVLALDLMRAAMRSDALGAIVSDARSSMEKGGGEPALMGTRRAVERALAEIERRALHLHDDRERAEANARSLAMAVASTYACARLIAQGAWALKSGDGRTAATASRLAERGLVPPEAPTAIDLAMDDGAGVIEPTG